MTGESGYANKCPDCGVYFKKLGRHLNSDECEVSLTDEMKQIIDGLIAGDGSVNRNNHFSVSMTNKEFMRWLDSGMGNFSNGIHVDDPSEMGKKDMYRLSVVTIDHIRSCRDRWYDGNGDKVFPEDIYTGKLFMKMWYVCDGTYNSYSASISTSNPDRASKTIRDLGFDVRVKNVGKTSISNKDRYRIYINSPIKSGFFDYMGDSPPGFEYKWPDRKV